MTFAEQTTRDTPFADDQFSEAQFSEPQSPTQYAGTAARILDTAERLMQQRGFNGFSYADIAAELGVSKPSLHYHFAAKADLGSAVLDRYRGRFRDALAGITAASSSTPASLAAFADLFANVLEQHRLCLCGMLSAELETLPDPMRVSVAQFFAESEAWLANVLESGRAHKTLEYDGDSETEAAFVLATLEGAMLVARATGGTDRFRAVASRLVDSLSA